MIHLVIIKDRVTDIIKTIGTMIDSIEDKIEIKTLITHIWRRENIITTDFRIIMILEVITKGEEM